MKDDPPARIDEPKLRAAVRRWLLRYIRRAREAKKEPPPADPGRGSRSERVARLPSAGGRGVPSDLESYLSWQ